MFNIIDYETGFKIDFIIGKETEYALVAFSRRIRIEEFGSSVYVIALKDLIIAKLMWIQQIQSDKQLSDIKNLLQSHDIDHNYLYYWIEKLRLKTISLLSI